MDFAPNAAAKPPNLLAPEGRDVAIATVRGERVHTDVLTRPTRCTTLTAPFGASLPPAGENIGSEFRPPRVVSLLMRSARTLDALDRSISSRAHFGHKGGAACCRPS